MRLCQISKTLHPQTCLVLVIAPIISNLKIYDDNGINIVTYEINCEHNLKHTSLRMCFDFDDPIIKSII